MGHAAVGKAPMAKAVVMGKAAIRNIRTGRIQLGRGERFKGNGLNWENFTVEMLQGELFNRDMS